MDLTYDISQPAFVFSVYDDQRLVQRLIRQLRGFYPYSDLLCIADGVDDRDFAAIAREHNVNYLVSERLKDRLSGAWLERLLMFALLKTKAQSIIKTEGDTIFWRRFDDLKPPRSPVSGTISRRYGFPFVRGGCVFLDRCAVVRLIESKILKSERYSDRQKFSYLRYSGYRYPDEQPNCKPISLSDLILGDALHQLGIEVGSWDEVAIEFRDTPADNTGLRYAATHPHR